uniref:Uncharacterized protein n=1 Tax=Cannabis sativa TaxID=3483 RepID=A0A803P357_CANSA
MNLGTIRHDDKPEDTLLAGTMAKTRSKMNGKPISATKKSKKKGVTSVIEATRTESIEDAIGIDPLEFSEEDGNDMTS